MAVDIKIKRIHKFDGGGSLKAFVDITIDDCILIKGLKIVEGRHGLFVSMPAEQSARDHKWYPSVKCLDINTMEQLTKAVMDAYKGDGEEELF